MNFSRLFKGIAAALAFSVLAFGFSSAVAQTGSHTSSQFKGSNVNKGTVTHSVKNGKSVLTLSDDFVVPSDAPDPHWQVIDSNGQVYLLDKLKTKASGDSFKKEIVLPKYVKNVSKVQIWCAYFEVNLGEAAFSSPVM